MYVCMLTNIKGLKKMSTMVDQEKAGEEVGEGREEKDQEGG